MIVRLPSDVIFDAIFSILFEVMLIEPLEVMPPLAILLNAFCMVVS